MSNKIKWGVLGYARIAKNAFIPGLLKSSNSELYAIASKDNERLIQSKNDFKCEKHYSSYDDLLDDPNIQAIYIPLPNSAHKEWTIKAARKGKHILCEKPIALNTEECIEMINECKKNNVKLMEAFMYRYTSRTKKVVELLQSGIIGEVKHISSTFGFMLNRENDVRLKPELGGGSLYDVGCYPINFFGLITNASPISMSSEYIMENGVDVMCSAALKYENGIVCSLNSWFNSFSNVNSEITGTKGRIKIPDTFLGNSGVITVITSEGTQEFEIPEEDRYLLEIEDFSNAIIEDREPLFSMDESLRNIKIIQDLLDTMK
jgi:D-xylose 1-dehydrogenase (NADP+, D-xylono-1,5-lactone-forming)